MTKRNLLRLLERERERHTTIEARLIDQILHLSGHPWTTAPADVREPAAEARQLDYTFTPEQEPLV